MNEIYVSLHDEAKYQKMLDEARPTIDDWLHPAAQKSLDEKMKRREEERMREDKLIERENVGIASRISSTHTTYPRFELMKDSTTMHKQTDRLQSIKDADKVHYMRRLEEDNEQILKRIETVKATYNREDMIGDLSYCYKNTENKRRLAGKMKEYEEKRLEKDNLALAKRFSSVQGTYSRDAMKKDVERMEKAYEYKRKIKENNKEWEERYISRDNVELAKRIGEAKSSLTPTGFDASFQKRVEKYRKFKAKRAQEDKERDQKLIDRVNTEINKGILATKTVYSAKEFADEYLRSKAKTTKSARYPDYAAIEAEKIRAREIRKEHAEEARIRHEQLEKARAHWAKVRERMTEKRLQKIDSNAADVSSTHSAKPINGTARRQTMDWGKTVSGAQAAHKQEMRKTASAHHTLESRDSSKAKKAMPSTPKLSESPDGKGVVSRTSHNDVIHDTIAEDVGSVTSQKSKSTRRRQSVSETKSGGSRGGSLKKGDDVTSSIKEVLDADGNDVTDIVPNTNAVVTGEETKIDENTLSEGITVQDNVQDNVKDNMKSDVEDNEQQDGNGNAENNVQNNADDGQVQLTVKVKDGAENADLTNSAVRNFATTAADKSGVLKDFSHVTQTDDVNGKDMLCFATEVTETENFLDVVKTAFDILDGNVEIDNNKNETDQLSLPKIDPTKSDSMVCTEVDFVIMDSSEYTHSDDVDSFRSAKYDIVLPSISSNEIGSSDNYLIA